MILKTDFETFLSEIRPTPNQQKDLQTGHQTLRERLNSDDTLKSFLISDFLQGSYRRSTAIRPKGGKRSDVDIIVVTKFHEDEFTPSSAMDMFKPFLERYYKDKWRPQGRSFGIELSYVELDLVITSCPSLSELGLFKTEAVMSDDSIELARDWRLNESWVALAERFYRADAGVKLAKSMQEPEWKSQPLRIPDREANLWEPTHPLEQIRWTRDMNSRCDGHFVNIVKAIKWWRLENFDEPKHPRGFPLERLIGECCPSDGILSIAEGVTRTLETIVTKYAATVKSGGKPKLPDYGVETHDVFKRITESDFAAFYEQVKDGAILARRAFDSQDRTESGERWRKLLGSKFPAPPEGSSGTRAGFSSPTAPATPGNGRFA